MKINKFVVFIGAIVMISAIALAIANTNQNSGFNTDSDILTMELPVKEGMNAMPVFSLKADFPKIPDSIGIYELKSNEVTKESIENLAKSRGILNKKTNVRDLENTLVYQTETGYLSVEKNSGAESLVNNYENLYSDRKEPLPSESVLRKNAESYVKNNNILPQGYEYSGMSYLTKQLVSKKGPEGKIEKEMGIAKYSRNIDGIAVEGAGSKINVLLGEGGNAKGYTKVSREVGKKLAVASEKPNQDKRYELISPLDAYKLLEERGLTTEIANVDKAVVTKVSLAYFENEGSKKQDVIEPVYVFSGTATGEEGTVEFQEYMYALKLKAINSKDNSGSMKDKLKKHEAGIKDEELRK